MVKLEGVDFAGEVVEVFIQVRYLLSLLV